MFAGARSTAGTMEEGLRVGRRFGLDHQRDIADVDASRGNIRGDQDTHESTLERSEMMVALLLRQIALQIDRRNAVLDELLGEFLGLVLGTGEDDALILAAGERTNHLRLVVLGDLEHMLGERVDLGVGGIDRVDLRLMQEFVDKLVDTMVEGRGEQHALSIRGDLREQFLNRGQEAHIGHLIGFVKHRDTHGFKAEQLLIEQVLEAPRAGNHNLGAATQPVNLTALAHTAVDGDGTYAVHLGERPDDFINLVDQLSGRCEHECTRVGQHGFLACVFVTAVLDGVEIANRVIGVAGLRETGDQRDGEREGLAGTGLASTENIASGKGIRQGVRLDGERRGFAVTFKRIDQFVRNPQFGEGARRLVAVCGGIGRGGLCSRDVFALVKFFFDVLVLEGGVLAVTAVEALTALAPALAVMFEGIAMPLVVVLMGMLRGFGISHYVLSIVSRSLTRPSRTLAALFRQFSLSRGVEFDARHLAAPLVTRLVTQLVGGTVGNAVGDMAGDTVGNAVGNAEHGVNEAVAPRVGTWRCRTVAHSTQSQRHAPG